jgi:hypothetical protein
MAVGRWVRRRGQLRKQKTCAEEKMFVEIVCAHAQRAGTLRAR